MKEQREFAEQTNVLEGLKAFTASSLAALGEMFASLQQRGFRGEL
jgi:hypothetical protein